MRITTVLTAIVAALGIAPGAYAQGCALCYTTASATSSAAQHSLRMGIFTLLIPALALFLGVFFLLIRRAIAAAA